MKTEWKWIAILALMFTLSMSVLLLFSKHRSAPKFTPPSYTQRPPQWVEPEPEPEPEPDPYTFEDAVTSITEESLKKDLYYLASDELEGRMSGKRGNVIAAKFIKDKFESFGLKTMYHRFRIRRMNSGPKNERGDDFTQNIYGWIEGNDPELKDEIVVIGAHMDHIGYGPSMSRWGGGRIHPGADDNASGTVALLEIAEAFSMMKDRVKRTIVFQAYSAEEMGLIGSRYYCNNPEFPIYNPSMKKHVFMLNMDMIGHLGQGRFATSFFDGNSSIDIDRYIRELNEKYSFARSITGRRGGGSDHACFYNKRVPVAFLHTGGHSHYHKPSDTPDRINYSGMEKVARYGFELAWKVVQSEASPTFNHGGFKELPYIHDHGHGVPFIHNHTHGEN